MEHIQSSTAGTGLQESYKDFQSETQVSSSRFWSYLPRSVLEGGRGLAGAVVERVARPSSELGSTADAAAGQSH